MKRLMTTALSLLLAVSMAVPAWAEDILTETPPAAETEQAAVNTPEEETESTTPAEEEMVPETTETPAPVVLQSLFLPETSFAFETAIGWETDWLMNEAETAYFLASSDENINLWSPNVCQLSVQWDTEDGSLPQNVDTSAVGEYVFTGTLVPPEGAIFADGLVVPPVTVTLTVLESIDKTQLEWPEINNFYKTNGFTFAKDTTAEEITEELNAWSFYLEYNNYQTLYPNIAWDLSSIQPDTPGWYTAAAMFTLPEEDSIPLRFALPEGLQPLSLPIYIRAPEKIELWIDSIDEYSMQTECFLPDGMELTNAVCKYAYCGTEKPDAEALAALTFQQDDMFFYYNGEDRFTADFYEMPDEQQGWYAFCLEIGEAQSNYVLIDSNAPTTSMSYAPEGDRDGSGSETELPDLNQPAPETKPDAEEDTQIIPDRRPSRPNRRPNRSDRETKEDKTEEKEEEKSPEAKDKPSSENKPETKTEDLPEAPTLTEQETAAGIVISDTRVDALIELDEPLVVHKNNVTVSISPAELEKLELEEHDLLSVEISKGDTPAAEVKINDEPVDAEMQVSADTEETAEAPEDITENEPSGKAWMALPAAMVLALIAFLFRRRKH